MLENTLKQSFILRPKGDPQVMASLMQVISQRNVEKTYEITIRLYHKTRSLEQNAYYWGIVLPTIQSFIRDHRGDDYSCEDVHEWYREQYLESRPVTIKGKTVIARPSTTKLSTKEFSDYLELVIHHAAENGIVIPPPDFNETA